MPEMTVGHITALDNAPPDRPDIYKEMAESVYSLSPKAATDDEKLTFEQAAEAVQAMDPNQQARVMMLQLDPLLRAIPFEQRMALLANLEITYLAEQPGVLENRGKVINALSDDFRKRLQKYLPLLTA